MHSQDGTQRVTTLPPIPAVATQPSDDRVIERFPAGGARGSWPADDFAKARRAEGIPAKVVMDLASDAFLVVKAGV